MAPPTSVLLDGGLALTNSAHSQADLVKAHMLYGRGEIHKHAGEIKLLMKSNYLHVPPDDEVYTRPPNEGSVLPGQRRTRETAPIAATGNAVVLTYGAGEVVYFSQYKDGGEADSCLKSGGLISS